MIIFWGSRLYGKTDEVPELFHVATKFGHIWYIPIIPLGSHLVLRKGSEGWYGAPIPFSVKSFLLAWLRAACLIVGIVTAVVGLTGGSLREGRWIEPAIVCVAAFAGFFVLTFARPFRYASYNRAVDLAESADMSKRAKVLIQLQFGMIDEGKARALFAAAEAEDIAAEEKALAQRRARLEEGEASEPPFDRGPPV